MKVLIACEFSGTVREAFLENGHDAWSCDILPSDDGSNRHIQDDVLNVLEMDNWDMLMVAHPPCTRLCLSGVRWLHVPPPGKTKEEMWEELQEGCELFSKLWNADIPKIAVENPVMHGHARKRIVNFIKPTQYVDPYQFTDDLDSPDNVTKKTGLWLKNLPPLTPTGSLTRNTARDDIHKLPPSADRWKKRSTFFPGIAKAMADQWGGVVDGS